MSNSQLTVQKTTLDGVLSVKPATLYEDFRGGFVETYNEKLYFEAGIKVKFLQDDLSISCQNVLRGMHGDSVTYKLLSCVVGRIYLIVLNWDSASSQHGKWESFLISDQNRMQILVPPKFAVGHLVMSTQAVLSYKQSAYYDRASQFTLLWNDPKLSLWWPTNAPIMSRRDQGLDGP